MSDLNSYELSRAFTDWAFENPEKIKPIHYAVYFFAIEHCNRLGWKKNFGLPSQMVMEAIGVKNWRTYSNALRDLVDFGFIKMVEVSKNQYSSNIVAIVKNTKAQSKALDKALSKHSQKQGTKHSQGTVSINKQGTRNKEQLNKEQLLIEPEKSKNEIPPLEEFLSYIESKYKQLNKDFEPYRFAATTKYETWKTNNWRDGYNKKIKNWKLKANSAIPHFKPIFNNSHNGTKFETAHERKQRADDEQTERLGKKVLREMYPHASESDIDRLYIEYRNDPSYQQSFSKGAAN